MLLFRTEWVTYIGLLMLVDIMVVMAVMLRVGNVFDALRARPACSRETDSMVFNQITTEWT